MSKVLIIGHPTDVHVDAVAWALEQRGHQALVWRFASLPVTQQAWASLSPSGGVAVGFDEAGNSVSGMGGCDVVWRRRVARPIPSEDLSEGDRTVALRESVALRDACLALVAPEARWINPGSAAALGDIKPLQLREAVKAGLRIPDTLCSNNPKEIRGFAARHGGRIVYKPFRFAVWRAPGKSYIAETTLLDAALLDNDFALTSSPGIYQPCLDKQYELRVTVMGQAVIAAKLTLADAAVLPTDIKPSLLQAKAVEVELPETIRQACLRLMAALGLVFGCIDLVVTTTGEAFFLEVNEAGQFLWLEGLNPDIPMLSLFADFIASGRPDFTRTTRSDRVSMAEYDESERFQRLDSLLDAPETVRTSPMIAVPEPV